MLPEYDRLLVEQSTFHARTERKVNQLDRNRPQTKPTIDKTTYGIQYNIVIK